MANAQCRYGDPGHNGHNLLHNIWSFSYDNRRTILYTAMLKESAMLLQKSNICIIIM